MKDNGDGTYTYVSEDGTITNIDLNKINSLNSVTDNGDGSYSFEDQSGNLLAKIETAANSNPYSNTNSRLTAGNVQDAIDELVASLGSGSGVSLIDNGDGTVSLVSADGTALGDIDKTSVTNNGDGSYTIDNGNGNPVTIDTNASSLSFDNSANGFTATDVQGAIEEIKTQLDGTTDILVDNGDGTFTHTAVDGTVVTFDANTTTLVDNTDGTYTLTNADGTTITVDTNANTSFYDNSSSGLTAGNVQNAIDEVVANLGSGAGVSLIDNGDGTVSLVSSDGTALGNINKTAVTDNGDGTYTIDNGNGAPVTIDTNASSLSFDNSANGFTATDVQGAIEEIKTQLDGTTDILVDNGDGTFTHTAVDGTIVTFDANTTTVTSVDGVYTFTDGSGGTIATIDTNASSLSFDNSANGFTATDVQGAIEEIKTQLEGTTDILVDNGDGTFTHTAVDGTVVTFDANTTTLVDNTDGTYTLTNADGTTITVDTNANASSYDNSGSGLTSDNVQNAIDELANTTDVLIDNGDGTFTHTAVGGSETTITSVMPKFFYMPSIVFNTSVTGTGLTRNLHAEYISQFSTPMVSSSGSTSTIPTLGAADLEYHVTYYDTTVFANVSIDANGMLTYDIIGSATPASFMNIVFVVK